MSEWKARRFWKSATVAAADAGWQVHLDGRELRTPNKHGLVLPSKAMAEAIAAEWNAQGELIRPDLMPITRMANSSIEKITPQFSEVADMLTEYGGTDLLCYRADRPDALAIRQAEGWDPLLDWTNETYGIRLKVTQGVMPVAQDPAHLRKFRASLDGYSVFELMALHDLVTLPGSLVLGLAVAQGRLSAAEAHDLSRIDEEFQAEEWGRDEEADANAQIKRDAMETAAYFLRICE